jgi:TonB family protein
LSAPKASRGVATALLSGLLHGAAAAVALSTGPVATKRVVPQTSLVIVDVALQAEAGGSGVPEAATGSTPERPSNVLATAAAPATQSQRRIALAPKQPIHDSNAHEDPPVQEQQPDATAAQESEEAVTREPGVDAASDGPGEHSYTELVSAVLHQNFPVDVVEALRTAESLPEVTLDVSDDGTIADVVLFSSSGNDELDDACVETAAFLEQLPPPPGRLRTTIHVLCCIDPRCATARDGVDAHAAAAPSFHRER